MFLIDALGESLAISKTQGALLHFQRSSHGSPARGSGQEKDSKVNLMDF